jgi:CBS domain-containing protein
MSDKFVRDVMHQGVVTCPETLTLAQATRLMTDEKVRALIVTDDKCSLSGILAQSDLVNAALNFPDPEHWRSTPVSEVMTRTVLTVTPEEPVNEAAKTMVKHHIHRIVVVRNGDPCTPVGVLSMGDLVRDMMKEPSDV